MTTTEQIIVHDRLFIGGELVTPVSGETIDVVNPANEELIGRVPAAGPEDVGHAVLAAQSACETWSRTAVGERAAVLERVSATLQDRACEVGAIISLELGMPIELSKAVQAWLPMATFADTAQRLREQPPEERVGHSVVVREPIGVVGAITPWNFPLHQIAATCTSRRSTSVTRSPERTRAMTSSKAVFVAHHSPSSCVRNTVVLRAALFAPPLRSPRSTTGRQANAGSWENQRRAAGGVCSPGGVSTRARLAWMLP